jgi:hypothetical protein
MTPLKLPVWAKWFLIIGAQVVAFASVYFLTKLERVPCVVIYALWALLPPAYFVIDYAYLTNWEDPHLARWERLADLSRSYWKAILTIMSVVYLARFGAKLFD